MDEHDQLQGEGETIKLEKVEGEDNLLMSILIRLPPKSIFKFRSVSKRWNNIIWDSYFFHNYEEVKREQQHMINKRISDGLFAFIRVPLSEYSHDPMTILPTTNTTSMYSVKRQVVPLSFGNFINYSNGLILFATDSLQVYNLQTRKSIVVPVPPSILLEEAILGLSVCRQQDQLTPSYRLVAAARIPDAMSDNTLCIQTYSSKTREWEKSTLIATERFCLKTCMFVADGVFHWDATESQLAVIYNSNTTSNNHVQLIQLPSQGTISRRSSSSNNSSCHDDDAVLWLATFSAGNMEFWMLLGYGRKRSTPIPKSEWILMHTLTYDSLYTGTVKLLPSLKSKSVYRIINGDEILELQALVPCSTSPTSIAAVIKVVGERIVFLYDVSTKSFELVRYQGYCIDPSRWIPCSMDPIPLSTYNHDQ